LNNIGRRPLLSRVAFVGLVLVVLLDIGIALGSVNPLWQELGGSASGDGVSQTPSLKAAFEARVAVGANGRPVVVYTEYPDVSAVQGAITVKRWTGSAWERLSGPSGIAVGYEPQVRVATDGAIYVAWLTADTTGNAQVRLRVWTGGPGFDELGGSDSPGGVSGNNAGIAAPFSLALDASGRPLVAFPGVARTGIVNVPTVPGIVDGTTQVYVRRWTGSAWAFVGSDFTGGGASRAVSVKGAAGNLVHDADAPSLTVDSSGAPVVSFTYYTTLNGQPVGNTDIFVTRWNGSAWTVLGPAVPAGDTAAGRGGATGVSSSAGGSYNASLGAGPAGRLALAWEDDQPTGEIYVRVRVWNGTTWSELGGSATGSGFNPPGSTNLLPSIAIGPDGRPIVAWGTLTDFASPSQIFVRRWNGTSTWEEVGFGSGREGGISEAAISAFGPSLALTSAGAPTVAWLDVHDEGDGQVFLRQFFSTATVPLAVRVAGSGTVTSDPPAIRCASASCTTALPRGTAVTLAPQAASGWTFTGWSGDCTGTGPCAPDLTASRNVTATFAAIRRLTLAVVVQTGTSRQGTVGSIEGPGGTCAFGGGTACAVEVLSGTRVTLQAKPAPGNSFQGWSGALCNNQRTPVCSFMATTANVGTTALFRAVTTVSVAKAGNGSGTVYADNITCGTDCAESVFTGTAVTLTPTPATGSIFAGWSGDICPTILPNGACRFTASGLSKSFTATFQPQKQQGAAQVPPAQVPPAQVPPAQVPPAQVPRAQVPPAQVPPASVPPARVEEVVLDVPPVLCADNGGTLKMVPSGDTSGYLCVRTIVSGLNKSLTTTVQPQKQQGAARVAPAQAPPARVPPAQVPSVKVPPAQVPPARVPPAQVPPASVPPARVVEVVLDVPPVLCADNGGTLKMVPSGDTSGYLCVRTTVSGLNNRNGTPVLHRLERRAVDVR
jgi:uncharacterized repeat protein (TIGR02543 family)